MPKTSIEGLEINYEHYVPSGSPPVQRVIYVHGTGCNGRVFEDHLRVMSNRHEAVAIDLPGHGGSEGSGFRSVTDYAFFVGALVEYLGWKSCVVAGHSLGGGIALAAAVYFEGLVSGLMLIDTGARLRVNPKILDLAREAAREGRAIEGDSRLGYAQATPQAIVDSVNAVTAGCDPRVIHKDWIADDSFDFMSRLAQIAVPALAICGEQDPLTPLKYHEYLADNLPDCRLATVTDAGHWPFVENAAVFNAHVLEFLDRL
jgi:pimeloyl-ACP methyl ester carboxylesterase